MSTGSETESLSLLDRSSRKRYVSTTKIALQQWRYFFSSNDGHLLRSLLAIALSGFNSLALPYVMLSVKEIGTFLLVLILLLYIAGGIVGIIATILVSCFFNRPAIWATLWQVVIAVLRLTLLIPSNSTVFVIPLAFMDGFAFLSTYWMNLYALKYGSSKGLITSGILAGVVVAGTVPILIVTVTNDTVAVLANLLLVIGSAPIVIGIFPRLERSGRLKLSDSLRFLVRSPQNFFLVISCGIFNVLVLSILLSPGVLYNDELRHSNPLLGVEVEIFLLVSVTAILLLSGIKVDRLTELSKPHLSFQTGLLLSTWSEIVLILLFIILRFVYQMLIPGSGDYFLYISVMLCISGYVNSFVLLLNFIPDTLEVMKPFLIGVTILLVFAASFPMFAIFLMFHYLDLPTLGLIVITALYSVGMLFFGLTRLGRDLYLKLNGETLFDRILADGVSLDMESVKTRARKENWYIEPTSLVLEEKLGSGGFANVFCGKWIGTAVAVKMPLKLFDENDIEKDFLAEIGVFVNLRHPCVVQFYGACFDSGYLAIVSELCPEGSLFDIIRSEAWNAELRKRVLVDVASGCSYLHSQNLYHGDLKSPNILKSASGSFKITDFGTTLNFLEHRSENVGESLTDFVGSPAWSAPEALAGTPVLASDIFAFGIVISEVCLLEDPWGQRSTNRVVVSILQGIRPSLPLDIHDDVREMASCCWAPDPSARSSFQQVLRSLENIPVSHYSIPSRDVNSNKLEMARE
jgi:hypothetical protein